MVLNKRATKTLLINHVKARARVQLSRQAEP
jgi:hypothetical protein